MTTACRSTGRDIPRVLPGRHDETCADHDACAGCLPCAVPHCVDCRRSHVQDAHACATCVGNVRDHLKAIDDAYARLDAEAQRRGVESDAADLLGPVTNLESWGHHAASALGGRIIPAGCDARDVDDVRAWYDRADRDTHPLWSLPLHADLARDALDHTIPTEPVTVGSEAAYLRRHLTDLAHCEHYDWRAMSSHIARTRARLDVATHDEAEGDRANVGCFDCHGTLERKLTDHGFDDHWTCQTCRRRYTSSEYHLALRKAIEQQAVGGEERLSA